MEDNRRFDKFGNLIQIGDTVFFCLPTKHYARLEKGKVIGFTPKMIEVEYFDDWIFKKNVTTKLYPDRLAVPVA